MITVVNYGLGNVLAIANIYHRLNIGVTLAETAGELAVAERVILPGVGAFDWAMGQLEASGMRPTLDELVLKKKRPVLGICVGMQMLAKQSEEGVLPGLGWIDGAVKRFPAATGGGEIRLPHMGWNNVAPRNRESLFRGMDADIRFYFLHSYYFAPSQDKDILAETDYHGSYASSVRAGNIFGVQFHPEKSHQWGIQLLRNFAELDLCCGLE